MCGSAAGAQKTVNALGIPRQSVLRSFQPLNSQLASCLTSVDSIQKKTGPDFLQKLSAADPSAVETQKADALWK